MISVLHSWRTDDLPHVLSLLTWLVENSNCVIVHNGYQTATGQIGKPQLDRFLKTVRIRLNRGDLVEADSESRFILTFKTREDLMRFRLVVGGNTRPVDERAIADD